MAYRIVLLFNRLKHLRNKVVSVSNDIIKLKEAFREAIKAMSEAPDGCRTCHYPYDI